MEDAYFTLMKHRIFSLLTIGALIAAPLYFVESPLYARVIAIAAICLFVWISQLAPPIVPTLLLWTLVPLAIYPIDPRFSLQTVLTWAVDPVMALFFGGFTLGVAAEVYGLDKRLAAFALRFLGRSFSLFLLLIILITAFFSMWLSNIAAAALVLACLRPVLREFRDDHLLRRTLLIGVALGADFGGIATPIGTGPNAIAIASLAPTLHVSFVEWMVFAFPLTVGMLILSYGILLFRARSETKEWVVPDIDVFNLAIDDEEEKPSVFGERVFLLILAATVVLWLTEPLHKIPAAVIALASAATLFLSGTLQKKDVLRIDWSTLLLIAGGITLGRLLEQSGLVKEISANIPFSELNITLSLFVICCASALLSAVMSNTATVVLLIPLATAIIPAPSTAILVAISASFGIPFVIGTPPNAMAFGEGGVKFGDLFWPGLLLMVVGCLIVSLTGRAVLNFVGIP